MIQLVQEHLTDDLRKAPWKGNINKFAGHCYVASEALQFLLGKENYKPMTVKHEGVTHWFLQNRITKEILDPTVEQFETVPDYTKAVGRGFLTKKPCKRTQILLERIRNENR